MVDRFSRAGQRLPSFTPAFLANLGKHPCASFLIFATAHATIWTILPFTLYPNLPLDIIEALTCGREWQLGYDKLPPLPWWLVEMSYRAFNSDFAYYALSQISVLSAFAAVSLTPATPLTAPAGEISGSNVVSEIKTG
jgi:hypothetical protein